MNALLTLGLPVIRAEIYLCVISLFLLLYGAYRNPRANITMVFIAIVLLALTGFLVINGGMTAKMIFQGMFISNAYTVGCKLLILTASILVLMLSADWLINGQKPFEFVILVLLSTLGMMLLVSAGSLLSLYMALEMMSLALYVLASFSRDDARSTEAGLKYFVLGALASGMILFGTSLVYGFAGTINFEQLGVLFSQSVAISRVVVVGLVLIIIGFCFKLSVAPFHMWTPDVYEGAPTPVTAFFATAPKVAAMGLFLRLLNGPFLELKLDWQQILIAASMLSLLVGALGAIMQNNIKRLLAYSSIGHVGFMLMAVAVGTPLAVQSVLIYLAVYVFMSVAMFGCVMMMHRGGESVEAIGSLAGLSKTKPWMAFAIACAMFSMAGIPPLSGFFGKMYVVIALVNAHLVWLAVFGVATSVVSCYYYLKIVKIMYFDEPTPAFDGGNSLLLRLATIIGTAVTLLFFLLPTPLVDYAKMAAGSLVP